MEEVLNVYKKELGGLSWLELPEDADDGERHSYFTYCIRVKNNRRDALAQYLFKNNIYTTLRFHPLHMNPIYGSVAKLPNSERLNEVALNIPLHPGLSESDLNCVIEKIRDFNG